MDDMLEQEIFSRMHMTDMEEKRFGLVVRKAEDTVIPPFRKRETCSSCCQIFLTEHDRLWHQFVHVEAYNGFLDGKKQVKLPDFNYYIQCPFPNCGLKFADFIDAKFHYLLEHQSCQLFCCGVRFPNYWASLKHLETAEILKPSDTWYTQEHFLYPMYVCTCCNRLWPSRTEYTAHLHGRDHMCPDPVCKYIFDENEKAIRHYFEQHYKHLLVDGRHILLNFKNFLKYEEVREERSRGIYNCCSCFRRFHDYKRMERHVESRSCLSYDKKLFLPVVPCKCGHKFVYCFFQRDLLLRNLPILKEALEHVAREAPYNGMPDDVCKIYHSIINIVADVNQRLISEKYTNYQRTNSSKHSSFTGKQVAKIILGVVDYFANIL